MTINLQPPSLTSFGKDLRAVRRTAQLTLDQLASATGISKPYLSNIETGRTPGPPSEEKLKRLARALPLDPADLLAAADWLRTPPSIRKAILGTHTPRRADGTINLDQLLATQSPAPAPAPIANESTTDNASKLRQVPLINKVAAGQAGEFGDLSYPAGVADAYVAAPDLPDAPAATLFALRLTGDSMAPEYQEGEIIVVGPPPAPRPGADDQPRDGQDCVVRLGELKNFATTFKRVFYIKDNAGEVSAVRLVPLNPTHQERTIPLTDVTGIYPLAYRLVPAKAPAKLTKSKASEKLRG